MSSRFDRRHIDRSRPGVRFVRNLSGGRLSERGAALVEAMIILPVLILVCFGLVEFGLIYQNTLKLSSATRAGARAGASAITTTGSDGQTSDADFQILQAVQAALGPLADPATHGDTVIVIYKASHQDGTPGSSGCDVTGSGTVGICNVYTASMFNPPLMPGSFAPDNKPADCVAVVNTVPCQRSQFWPSGSRHILFNDPPDWLGVWVKVRHDYTTGIFGPSRTLSDQTVIRLEPPGANPSLYTQSPTSFATTTTTAHTGISAVVWDDSFDQDGIRDGFEGLVSGVAYTLKDMSKAGIVVASGTTAANGQPTNATALNLIPGDSYTMTYTAPGTDTFTLKDKGVNPLNNSQVIQSGAAAGTFTWTAQTGVVQPVNAGLIVPVAGCTGACKAGSLSGIVWNDANDNGIRQTPDLGGTEPFLLNVVVNLYLAGGSSPVLTTFTDVGGNYTFANLAPGNYFVKVIKPANGDVFAPQESAGSTPTNDSDVNSSGQSGLIAVASNTNTPDNDAGIYVPGCLQNCVGGPTTTIVTSISGTVWNDINFDGIRQGTEPLVSGQTVQLLNPINGQLIAQTTTDASGHYTFGGLVGGVGYEVRVVPATGQSFTTEHAAGGNTTTDSDVNGGGYTATVTAVSNSDVVGSSDAGVIFPSISGTVWKDSNGDGIRQASEPKLNNITVTLLSQAGATVATVKTNGNGFYNFNGVVPGSYFVQFGLAGGYGFSPENQGTDPTIDSNADPVTGKTTLLTTTYGSSFTNIDAGEIPPNPVTTTTIPPS